MRHFIIALVSLTGVAAATPAWAVGQCFDRGGRPIGPTYDVEQPDYNFIRSVYARGGTCLSMNDTAFVTPPAAPLPIASPSDAHAPGAVVAAPGPPLGSVIQAGPYLYNAYNGVIAYSGPRTWNNGTLRQVIDTPAPSTILHSRPPAATVYPRRGWPG